jgi:heme A synthase
LIGEFAVGRAIRRLIGLKTLRMLSLSATAGTLLAAMLGRAVRAYGASLSVPDWPLFEEGRVFPGKLSRDVALETAHRFTVMTVGALVVAMAVVAFREGGRVRLVTLSLLALLLLTALVGGLTVLYQLPKYVAVVDEALALALLTALTALTTWLYLGGREGARAE